MKKKENKLTENLITSETNNNLALNKTNDGQEFLSFGEPRTEYSDSSERNLQQEGDTNVDSNNRRSVRAIWTKYKNIQFKGTTKIKNAAVIAQIMRELENKLVEHAFIQIDQKGN
ncbi:MAG: hypothetical protein H7239_13130 [Flavobacterium sp.]|nr:hypothetical protein [Flavobacterium sp.]